MKMMENPIWWKVALGYVLNVAWPKDVFKDVLPLEQEKEEEEENIQLHHGVS